MKYYLLHQVPLNNHFHQSVFDMFIFCSGLPEIVSVMLDTFTWYSISFVEKDPHIFIHNLKLEMINDFLTEIAAVTSISAKIITQGNYKKGCKPYGSICILSFLHYGIQCIINLIRAAGWHHVS